MPDFVIVGAGSAGCVLAERLSASHSVLLLESGCTDRHPEVMIPAAFSKLFKTRRDWDFSTGPEPGAQGRSLFMPRGHMIGGSSSMNAMLYVRGRPSDFDGWKDLGATGWGWDDVEPHFVEIEGARPAPAAAASLLISEQRHPNPVTRAFIEAAMAAGHPANNDFNDGIQEGVGLFRVTQKRGRRWSAADAFLRAGMGRPTLEVRQDCRVVKLLIESGRAVGVEYVANGHLERAHADAEVIVAAGAIGSPHLLQVSGIGAPDHLRSIGVDVVAELPGVGEGLHDHPVVPLMHETPFSGTLDQAETTYEKMRWALFRSGRLTSPVAEAGLFARSNEGLAQPDLQFHFGPANFSNHGLGRFDGHAFTFGPVLIDPESRGWVRARDGDPSKKPEIITNCLVETRDVDALVNGVEIGREVARQEPLEPFRGPEVLPGEGIRGEKELEEYVRSHVELLYHPVGTCRMGTDDVAVVDPRLRVNGLSGLRVVDASVMPKVVSGNTNAATMMIAARAARMIAEDQANGSSN